jgi:signal transduction histidine kinase/ActR/RegA family two-component response regulator
MRLYLLYFILFNTLTFSQKNDTEVKTDSVKYYLELTLFNAKDNNYKDALYYTQKGIDFAHNHNSTIDEAKSYASMGHIYFELNKYDDAIENFKKSSFLYDKLEPSSEQAYNYYQLGMCYMEINNCEIAETYFDKAKSIYIAINLPDAIELLNLQKGIVHKTKGDYDLAIEIFSAIVSKPDEDDAFKTKAEALYQLGTIEIIKGRNNLALNYLERALELNQRDHNLEQKAKILLSLSDANEKLLNLKLSYSYLKQHLQLKDSIEAINNKKLGADDYVQFKENERIKAVAQLDKENKQQQKSSKIAKLISILSFALILILSLLSFSLYRNVKFRTKSNLLLKEKNTELQLAKNKAEKAIKARSEFLSTVSHELRTPLNAINGITHLLLNEKPKKSQINYLTSLKFSGNYLMTFINDILEINRIESSMVETEEINFNLKLLLDNIQHSLKELATINNNAFVLDIDQNIPDFLIGDPTKLSQIFMNLINNALKFTKNGQVKVILKANEITTDFADINFDIVDTGIGIPDDKQQNIFESFSQGSVEINRKYGGTGLGLAIVKKLIEILGGNIKLESEMGKGSTFSFQLNFKIGAEDTIVQNDSLTNIDDVIFKDKKVLLIEDNKINQMITKKMVTNKGMICEVIDNGEDAITALKNNKYDLVLMDVHLPGINGTIATQTIRTFDKTTVIIALTAISLNENRDNLMSFGMNDVITKPFDPKIFYKVLAENMQKSNIV